jgi:hypothetical protein
MPRAARNAVEADGPILRVKVAAFSKGSKASVAVESLWRRHSATRRRGSFSRAAALRARKCSRPNGRSSPQNSSVDFSVTAL